MKNDGDSPADESSATASTEEGAEASAKPNPQKAEMLPVAYHNLAVECEHLGRYDDAMDAYLQASNAARQRLGPKDPLTVAMQGALDAALKAAKDGTRKAPAPEKAGSSGSKTHRGPSSSAPWEANKNVTPRTRHKPLRPTAPHAAKALAAKGMYEAPPGKIGNVYQEKRTARSKGRKANVTIDDMLGSLPPIDGPVEIASYIPPKQADGTNFGSIPLARQRQQWERLPWDHVEVDSFFHDDSAEFMPPPLSARQSGLEEIYGKPPGKVPKPPPRLPPGVLYRPKRTAT